MNDLISLSVSSVFSVVVAVLAVMICLRLRLVSIRGFNSSQFVKFVSTFGCILPLWVHPW